MSIDRKNWLWPFSDDNVPLWLCPSCKRGTLSVRPLKQWDGEKKAVIHESSAKARTDRDHPSWHPMEDFGVFAGILTCSNCADVVAVSGKFTNDMDYDREGRSVYTPLYTPYHFYPPIDVFPIPKDCPPDLKEEIVASFSVFWGDAGSCINHIRTAIELLLNDIGVIRFARTKSGKQRRYSLAERVDLLPPKYSDLKHSLTALRWLGNAGSHSGKVTREDALDGFELLEHVIEERFDPRHKRIGVIAKGITKRKGPRKR